MAEFKNGVNYITGEDVLMVKKTNTVREYKSETEGYKGFKYRVYALGDKAFAVHENDDFHKAFEAGNIQKIEVVVTDEGWSLSNFVTWTQANNFKLNQMRNEAITVDYIKKASAVSVDQLLKASVE